MEGASELVEDCAVSELNAGRQEAELVALSLTKAFSNVCVMCGSF